MNNTNELEKVDIKRLFEIVLDRIVSIVVITLVFGLVAFVLSKYFITPKYESSITMYVNNKRSSAESEIVETKTLTTDITASQLLVPTYIEMIKSDNVLQKVSKEVEKKTKEKFSAHDIREMMTAEALPDTEIIKISIRANEPAIAREIANTISEIAPNKIKGFIELSNVVVIDGAKVSTNPVSPNVRNTTIIGALLGFVLSVSFILLKELFDVRVKSVDDLVAKFQYPVLGTIPEIYISYDESAIDDSEEK